MTTIYGFARSLAYSTAMLLALTSCSSIDSTFVGDRDPAKGDRGILVRLSKPVFTVTTVANSDPTKAPSYQLSVKYEPNAGESVRVRYSPGFLKDSEFGVKLANGTLTGVSAKATDQVGPTLTALATFTANIIGAAAKVATLESSDIRDDISEEVKAQPGEHDSKCDAKVAVDLAEKIKTFKSDDDLRASFYWRKPEEKVCLEETRDRLKKDAVEEMAEPKKVYDEKKDALIKKDAAQKSWLETIDAAVKSLDTDRLTRINNAIPENDPLKAERKAVIAAANQLVPAATSDATVTMLTSFVDMKDKVWRRRHVLYLERKIDDLSMDTLRTSKDHTGEIQDLHEERANAIGALPEYQEINAITKLKSSLRPRADRTNKSAITISELQKADEALANVVKAFEAKRTKVLDDGKPEKPAIEIPKPSVAELVDSPPTADKLINKSSEFVLVLENAQ
jgi:hypothetical protein